MQPVAAASMSPPPLRFEEVLGLWQEGERRLRAAAGGERAALERVVDALVDELRRRVGPSYTADELARRYVEDGIDWCFEVAVRAAPSQPAAWDLTTVSGAAFARYVRGASDFGGGRRLVEPESE
jgi:hypothetical protein